LFNISLKLAVYNYSSQFHVGYVKCGPGETFLDNEALWFQPMVMSGSHYLSLTYGINDTINIETLPQGTFQKFHLWVSWYALIFNCKWFVNLMMELKLGWRDPTCLHFP
jgi:hypothetical protein